MKTILLLLQFLFVTSAFSQSGSTFSDCLGNVATQGKINFVVKTSSRQLRHDLNHMGLTVLSYQQNVIATKSTHHQPSDFVNNLNTNCSHSEKRKQCSKLSKARHCLASIAGLLRLPLTHPNASRVRTCFKQ